MSNSFTPSFIIPPSGSTSSGTTTGTTSGAGGGITGGSASYTGWLIILLTIAGVFLLFFLVFMFSGDSGTVDSTGKSSPDSAIMKTKHEQLLSQLGTFLTSPTYSDAIQSV